MNEAGQPAHEHRTSATSLTWLRMIHRSGPVRSAHHHPLSGFNRRLAVGITGAVGTMWCAYAFAALSLAGMPLWAPPWVVQAVQWISQNFIQLVLLSILMVGQSVIGLAADAQRERDHEILGHEVEVLTTLHDLQVEQTAILRRLDPGDPQQAIPPESTSTKEAPAT